MNKFSKQLTIKNLLILILVIILPLVIITSYNFIIKLSKEKEIEIAKQREKQVLDSISSVKIYDTLNNVAGLTNCVLKTKYFENEMTFIFSADIIDQLNILPGSAQYPKYPTARNRITLNFYDEDNFRLIAEDLYLNSDLTTIVNKKGDRVGISANSKITEFTKDKYLKIHHWDFSWSY